MLGLTEDAVIVCDHQQGVVQNEPSQHWVTIEGRAVLVATDPQGRTIKGCPNINYLAGQKPCSTTLRVSAGYSTFVRIGGRRLCLDSLTGLTDGSPPGTFHYTVRTPGQAFVSAGG